MESRAAKSILSQAPLRTVSRWLARLQIHGRDGASVAGRWFQHPRIQHSKRKSSTTFHFPSGTIRERNLARQAGTCFPIDSNGKGGENRSLEPLLAGPRILCPSTQHSNTKSLNFHSFQSGGIQSGKVDPLTGTSADGKPSHGSTSSSLKSRSLDRRAMVPAPVDPALKDEAFQPVVC